MRRSVVCLLAAAITVLFARPAPAADIRVMISAGFFKVYEQLGPAFEKATGHKLITTRGPSLGDSPEAIPTRLARGEGADVVIMDGHGADILEARSMVLAGSRMPLAESFIGMVVRAGQPKPDIGTVEALAKALLAAKSIAYSDSSSGTYLSTVGFAKLGVADQVAELINVAGTDFVGTVPAEIQPPTHFVGALPNSTEQPEAAVALLRYLSSTEAAAVISKAGLKPLAR